MFISFPSINSRTPAAFSMKLLSMLIYSFMFSIFTHWIVLRSVNVNSENRCKQGQCRRGKGHLKDLWTMILAQMNLQANWMTDRCLLWNRWEILMYGILSTCWFFSIFNISVCDHLTSKIIMYPYRFHFCSFFVH